MAFVREHPRGLAFLDKEMPEMSGLELAVRLTEILRISGSYLITA
jgi:CheY-like chemotaxis protein